MVKVNIGLFLSLSWSVLVLVSAGGLPRPGLQDIVPVRPPASATTPASRHPLLTLDTPHLYTYCSASSRPLACIHYGAAR